MDLSRLGAMAMPTSAIVLASTVNDEVRTALYRLKRRFGPRLQLCDGVADDVEIQAAIAALGATGGHLFISEGTFTLAAKVAWANNVVGSLTAGTTITLANSANVNMFDFSEVQYGGLYGHQARINGNRANNTAGIGIYGQDTKYSILKDLIFDEMTEDAIKFQASDESETITLENMTMLDVEGYGIHLRDGVKDCTIKNPNCENGIGGSTRHFIYLDNVTSIAILGGSSTPTGDGIYVTGDSGDIAINGHIVDNGSGHGLHIVNNDGSTQSRTPAVTVNGGSFSRNSKHGILVEGSRFVSLMGVAATQNDRNNTDTYSGIVLDNSSYNHVLGCICTDHRTAPGVPTQVYGIVEQNGSDNNVILGNTVTPNKTGTLVLLGAATKVFANPGFVTENKGTGTINNGATTAVITHGMGYTPAAADIRITFTESPTNDPGDCWISTITATQFTVNVRNDPGVSNLDFSWSARRH